MLIRNLKATGDCGVPIGVLDAFKITQTASFVVEGSRSGTEQRKAKLCAGVNGSQSEPCSE